MFFFLFLLIVCQLCVGFLYFLLLLSVMPQFVCALCVYVDVCVWLRCVAFLSLTAECDAA